MHVNCIAVAEQHATGNKPTLTQPHSQHSLRPRLDTAAAPKPGRERLSADDVTGGRAAYPGFEAGAFYIPCTALGTSLSCGQSTSIYVVFATPASLQR